MANIKSEDTAETDYTEHDESLFHETKRSKVEEHVGRLCEVCEEVKSKYTCPGCGVHTCSVPCVQKHKIQITCNGKRDKTAYIRVNKMTDMTLLSDYRFLEDCSRKCDSANRDPRKQMKFSRYPARMLAAEARKRGIDFCLMPNAMTKRRTNTTYINYRTRVIQWHVEWAFPSADVKYTNRVYDGVSIKEALVKYVHSTDSDPVLRQKLHVFVSTGIDQLSVFLKAEKQKCKETRYYSMNMDEDISHNLMRRTVVEYPTLYVALPNDVCNYPLMLLANWKKCAPISTTDSLQADVDNCDKEKVVTIEKNKSNRSVCTDKGDGPVL